jgi:hypothetical protein
MDTCQSLVKPPKGKKGRGNLRPCGVHGSAFHLQRAARAGRGAQDDGVQHTFMGVNQWKIQPGATELTQVLCDVHRRKAEREGWLVRPAGR